MRYVIIGNSAAAVGCIESIRKYDRCGEIQVFSRESQHTYARPLISYLLCGKTDLQKMKYRADDFYEKNNVEFHPGTSVIKIDPDKKTVDTADNLKYPYDRLLVAAGSDPIVPPISGIEKVSKMHTFMSLDDALSLETDIDENSRVLIVGAGLIGLKCAEGIAGRVKSITVVDKAGQILPSILDAQSAERVQKHMEAHGISFILGNSAAKFTEAGAELEDGVSVEFDVMVMAVGVRPNTALIKAACGSVARGILTDDTQKTSLPDVYAAGDCVESFDISCDSSRVLALLPNAYMQGECAGAAMTGNEKHFSKAIPMNSIGFFGLHIITAGNYTGKEISACDDEGIKKLYMDKNLLKGYILVGHVERAGIYTSLIREKTPLDTIDFELIAEKPQLMAFSAMDRKQKMGGRPQ